MQLKTYLQSIISTSLHLSLKQVVSCSATKPSWKVKQSSIPKWIHAVFSFVHRRHKNKYVLVIKVVCEDASSSWKEFGASVLIHPFVTTLGAKLHPLPHIKSPKAKNCPAHWIQWKRIQWFQVSISGEELTNTFVSHSSWWGAFCWKRMSVIYSVSTKLKMLK